MTFDADCQHRAIDAFKMLKKIDSKKVGMVIGTRFQSEIYSEIPPKEKTFLELLQKLKI